MEFFRRTQINFPISPLCKVSCFNAVEVSCLWRYGITTNKDSNKTTSDGYEAQRENYKMVLHIRLSVLIDVHKRYLLYKNIYQIFRNAYF